MIYIIGNLYLCFVLKIKVADVMLICIVCCVLFFKQKTAYEMRISDWSSDVCSSDLVTGPLDRAWFERIDGYGPPRPVDVDGTLALVAAEADVRTADAQVRVARSLRVPDLTVSASARRLAATNDTAAVVGISIPIPFFNNGRAFVAQSRSEQTQAIALRNLAVIDTRQQIASAQTEVANAADRKSTRLNSSH